MTQRNPAKLKLVSSRPAPVATHNVLLQLKHQVLMASALIRGLEEGLRQARAAIAALEAREDK